MQLLDQLNTDERNARAQIVAAYNNASANVKAAVKAELTKDLSWARQHPRLLAAIALGAGFAIGLAAAAIWF